MTASLTEDLRLFHKLVFVLSICKKNIMIFFKLPWIHVAEYLHIHYCSKVKSRCNEATTVPASQAIFDVFKGQQTKNFSNLSMVPAHIHKNVARLPINDLPPKFRWICRIIKWFTFTALLIKQWCWECNQLMFKVWTHAYALFPLHNSNKPWK